MLIDTTLREGLQARDIYLDAGERTELAARIAASGIEELEVGWADRGTDLKGVVDAVIGKGARPMLWSMARRRSLEEAARVGSPAVTVCLPASHRHQKQRFGLEPDQVKEWLLESVSTARSLFDFVQVGLEDASRADRLLLGDLIATAESAGAHRVRLADTVGLLSPREIEGLIEGARGTTHLPIGVHLHDDLGMATAGSVMAIESGAATADTSLLGLGERAGIAATEEVAAWAVLRRGAKYDLRTLRTTCAWLADKAGFEVPRAKAVAGRDIFATESGIHVEAIGRNPSLYEPWDPQCTGHERSTNLGAKSGRGAVRRKLQELGIPEPADLETLVGAIRNAGAKLRRSLRDEELAKMVGAH